VARHGIVEASGLERLIQMIVGAAYVHHGALDKRCHETLGISIEADDGPEHLPGGGERLERIETQMRPTIMNR
jgi:hypothetical protein